MSAQILDCTLRDGGYYNDWDFAPELVNEYLAAMQAAGVDIIELGLRTLKNSGFNGAFAYTTDEFIASLVLPEGITIGVMVNASELTGDVPQLEVLQALFPNEASNSPVDLVRIACHVHEFKQALPVATWLKERGFLVGFNLMQVADRVEEEIKTLAREAVIYPLDVLYFADSMGGMNPEQVAKTIKWFRSEWNGPMGIHTHDNMGLALSNTLRALDEGISWVDSTVTGMGRGPGNARTEEIAIEMAERHSKSTNLVPLMTLLRKHFKPMQLQYGWGTNPYYYLAGKYGIHPTYIQEMLSDSRYSTEDVLAVIEHLRVEGGKKFSLNTLDAARHFYRGEPKGQWMPRDQLAGSDLLLLGTGPGVTRHRTALERFIRDLNPVVVALNTQTDIEAELIDFRVACHPVRLLADCDEHVRLPQPLITPFSMLPTDVQATLANKEVRDFGLNVQADTFKFESTHCTTPSSLVMAYSFAIAATGKCKNIFLAGFDGYAGEDPRNQEMNKIVQQFKSNEAAPNLIAITPSRYDVTKMSIYGMNK